MSDVRYSEECMRHADREALAIAAVDPDFQVVCCDGSEAAVRLAPPFSDAVYAVVRSFEQRSGRDCASLRYAGPGYAVELFGGLWRVYTDDVDYDIFAMTLSASDAIAAFDSSDVGSDVTISRGAAPADDSQTPVAQVAVHDVADLHVSVAVVRWRPPMNLLPEATEPMLYGLWTAACGAELGTEIDAVMG